MPSKPKVAIIGAGPAGCTLARLLLNASIPVTIFEGEKSIDVRAQGGTLDLHTNTGQKALKEAGLFDEFLKYARYDGEAMAVMDKNQVAYLKMGGSTGGRFSDGRPEIDRRQLRTLLVNSLPEDTIKWGRRLRSVDPDNLALHFDNSEEHDFDLLVGADGAWSKVRPVLRSVQPHYAGLGGFDMVIPRAEEQHPAISKLANRGSTFVLSDGKGLTIQQRGDDSLMVYAWSARDEKWMEGKEAETNNGDRAKEKLLNEYDDWAGIFKKTIRAADSKSVVARSLYQLPVGFSWEGKPGVTIIGDAAHVMTPFAGEGVNLAMADALNLAKTIIATSQRGYDPQALANGVRKFELEMFKRSAPLAKVSKLNMEDMFFTPGAPNSSIASWVQRAIVEDNWFLKLLIPQWFVRLLLRWVFWW